MQGGIKLELDDEDVEVSSQEGHGDKIRSDGSASEQMIRSGGQQQYCGRRAILALVLLVCLGLVGYAFYPFENKGEQEIKDSIIIGEEHGDETDPPLQEEITKDQNSTVFEVQTNYWLFYPQRHRDLLAKLQYDNNKYFATKSGFKVQVVSAANHEQFMSEASVKRLNALKDRLFEEYAGQRQKVSSIISYLSFLLILGEKGGVIATDYFCLTDTLDWLKDVKNDLHVKRGLDGVNAEVVAFFHPERSSPSVKERINVKHETEKYMRAFPAIDPYFIAAKKGCRFIIDLTNEVFSLFENKVTDNYRYSFYKIDPNDLLANYFIIANQRVLQRKQRQLDRKYPDSQFRILAVDYYRLYYLNHYGSLRKLYVMTGNMREHVTFNAMTRYNAEEWRELFGPLKHLTSITPHGQMNVYLEQVINGRRDPIVRGSFFQKTFYPQGSFPFIVEDAEKPFINETSEPWSALPKKIFVFWDSGIQNAPLINQLCVELMRIRGKQSGFELNIMNKDNFRNFVSKETGDKIDQALNHPQLRTFVQSLADLIRVAVIMEHGGIYFDVSYCPLTNFDWLVNIGRFPSKHISNRYGHLPKVVMHFHPQWGGVYDWKIHPIYNTKVQWNLPYENNFIAAEKGSELIREWFELLIKFYQQPHYLTVKYMRQQKVVDLWETAYLMPMDTVMTVIGRKQREIKADPSSQWSDATDYYKIWSINGYAGIQKYRDRTGFESSFTDPDNNFVYRYSQEYVKGYLGLNFNLVKFYGPQNYRMSDYINNNKGDNFSMEAHPDSLFMRYVNHKDLPIYLGEDGLYKIRH